MYVTRIEATTTVTVEDHEGLRHFWRTHDWQAQRLIGRIVVRNPSQRLNRAASRPI